MCMKNRSITVAPILLVFVCLGLRHDWIELIIGVKPDRGNGLLEWLISALMIASGIAGSAVVRRQWHVC